MKKIEESIFAESKKSDTKKAIPENLAQFFHALKLKAELSRQWVRPYSHW